MNTITITDSILNELATVRIREDHLTALLNEGKVKRQPIFKGSEITGDRLEMKHTDFIDYLNEQAI